MSLFTSFPLALFRQLQLNYQVKLKLSTVSEQKIERDTVNFFGY